MSATSYLDVELDEGIFDRVNSEYKKEFDAYVKKVDQLLSTDLTFNKFGGESNYANLVSWTATYNINNDKSAAEAAMIRQAAGLKTFDMAHSIDNCVMFWIFLKTSLQFQKSPWYYREYMAEKLLGKSTVDVESIL